MGADVERKQWELRVDVGVGPLRFGKFPAEVAAVLLVSDPPARVSGRYGQKDYPGG